MNRFLLTFSLVACSFCLASSLFSQSPQKHKRATPPDFKEQEFEGIFYDDVAAQLVGNLPTTSATAAKSNGSTGASAATSTGDEETNVWKSRIDAATIEDLVKASKTRLDPAVASPAKFAGGGYLVARREFTMLAALFAVIQQYPGDIRWKHSADRAKVDFSRIAANAKVGSLPAFKEAETKNQLFGDLLRGERLEAPKESMTWDEAMDRGAIMQLIEWIYKEQLNAAVANDGAFKANAEELKRYSQLMGTLGEIMLQENMADTDSQEYVQWMRDMVTASEQVATAAEKQDINAARESIGAIDKSCNLCHDSFR